MCWLRILAKPDPPRGSRRRGQGLFAVDYILSDENWVVGVKGVNDRIRPMLRFNLWWEPILAAYCIKTSDFKAVPSTLGRSALALQYWG